ncbi:MAG: carboxymuconolactone decarboxylase family protein [Gammaproteobacteria bacterium]
MNKPATVPRGAALVDVFRDFPDTSKAIGALHREIMRRESAFSEGERELMAALVSALNGCGYCVGIHESAAEAFGIEPGLLAELLDDVGTARVDERLKPVLHFVARLALQPSQMRAADPQAVLAAGWDEKALFDAVCACSFYSFMNRYVDGTGLESAPDELRRMGRQIAAHDGGR